MIDVPRGEHNLSHSRDTPPVCALAHNKSPTLGRVGRTRPADVFIATQQVQPRK